jgi:hypothetical protein
MLASQTHKIVEVLALKDLLSDSGQQIAAKESVVLHLFEVDDPIANPRGRKPVVGGLFAGRNTEGDVLEREVGLFRSREEAR